MTRIWILIALLLCAPLLPAQPAPEPDGTRLPPPVERVLSQLSLDEAGRDQLRQTLLRQRQERDLAIRSLGERHRAELAALLNVDQLAAIDATRPPPPHRPQGERGNRPPPPPPAG